MKHKRALWGGMILLAAIFAFVMLYPAVSPRYYNQTDPAKALLPPFSPTYPLGTDMLGRDMVMNLAVAGRISLLSGFLTLILEMTLGTLLGAYAALCGGIADRILGFGIDVFGSLQQTVTLIALSALLSDLIVGNTAKIFIVSLSTALIFWPGVARMVRGEVLRIKASPQMLAAKAQGMQPAALLRCLILPNLLQTLRVLSVSVFGEAILMESTISFLGLGISAPLQSLGTMLESARNLSALTRYAHLWLPAALLMLLTLLSLQLISGALQAQFEEGQQCWR